MSNIWISDLSKQNLLDSNFFLNIVFNQHSNPNDFALCYFQPHYSCQYFILLILASAQNTQNDMQGAEVVLETYPYPLCTFQQDTKSSWQNLTQVTNKEQELAALPLNDPLLRTLTKSGNQLIASRLVNKSISHLDSMIIHT